MSLARLLLPLALAACTGAPTPPAQPDAPAEPPSAPVEAPPVEADPAPTPSDVATYVEALEARLASLEKVELPPVSEGDLTRTVVGWREDGQWLRIDDVQSVGEYGTQLHTYILRDGSLVYRGRAGHSHEPNDTNDSRFVYFEERVELGAGLSVLKAERREREESSSGLTVDLSAEPWKAFEVSAESLDLAEVLGQLNGGN